MSCRPGIMECRTVDKTLSCLGPILYAWLQGYLISFNVGSSTASGRNSVIAIGINSPNGFVRFRKIKIGRLESTPTLGRKGFDSLREDKVKAHRFVEKIFRAASNTCMYLKKNSPLGPAAQQQATTISISVSINVGRHRFDILIQNHG